MFRKLALFISIAVFSGCADTEKTTTAPAETLRMYVFDAGILHYDNADAYQLKREEVARTDMALSAFLVVHPKGTLMWDAGAVADSEIPADKPGPQKMHIVLPDKGERDVTMIRPLLLQLADAGYSPADITYLSLSHYHWDHIGNANAFASSTWLVRKAERDLMFAEPAPDRTVPANYRALAGSKTTLIDTDDYDVFGDGKVVLKLAAGHTPAHQVLFVDLPKTGPVVISGDLYHYPEERTLNRLPLRDFDKAQTTAARAALEVFLKEKGAQLWIQHDIAAHEKLKKAPLFYD